LARVGNGFHQEDGHVTDFEPTELVTTMGEGAPGVPLISVLEEIQARYRYLPREAMILVSEGLGLPLSQVYSVATFYNAFSLLPRGRHGVCVCVGTACHVRGAQPVLDRLEAMLGIKPGETTPDLHFSLETVNCLGACALGPIVVVDGKYSGQMVASKVDDLLTQFEPSD
jgi:NADH-quinone oxidoreductase subunit E